MCVIFTMFAFITTNCYTFTTDCNVCIHNVILPQISTIEIKDYTVQNDTPTMALL